MAAAIRHLLAHGAIWLLILQLAGGALAEDRRTAQCRLNIMTFNAEFLWDGVAPEEGSADFPWKGSQTEAEDHMRRVAEVIIQSDPDVVNLVEVENLRALTVFNERFLAGRGYRPYLVDGNDTATGQDVALLTRIDPEGEAIQRDDRKGQAGNVRKSVSKNYLAKLTVDNTKIAVVGLHFLARPSDAARRLEREAQADAIRQIARELLAQGHHLVVLGDFNDYDGEPDSRDHVDSVPISNVLRLLRDVDPADPLDDLVNAASFVPKGQRYTSFWDRNENGRVDPPDELTSIDHVLVSTDLAAKVVSVEMPHDHDPTRVTDHFPVVVRLKLCETAPTSPTRVRIGSLLPNPSGDESQNEEARVKNAGTSTVSLLGWTLRDLAGRTWTLDGLGSLEPGEEKTIRRRGQAMALDNRGDTIDLLDPAGRVTHTVTYGRVAEGEIVTPAE